MSGMYILQLCCMLRRCNGSFCTIPSLIKHSNVLFFLSISSLCSFCFSYTLCLLAILTLHRLLYNEIHILKIDKIRFGHAV